MFDKEYVNDLVGAGFEHAERIERALDRIGNALEARNEAEAIRLRFEADHEFAIGVYGKARADSHRRRADKLHPGAQR